MQSNDKINQAIQTLLDHGFNLEFLLNDEVPITGHFVCCDGTQYWLKNSDFHREDDPAVIYIDGSQEWYQNGKYHRLDGPAKINSEGIQYWYKEGQLHREDGPAIICTNGTQEWYKDGNKIDPPTSSLPTPNNEIISTPIITEQDFVQKLLDHGLNIDQIFDLKLPCTGRFTQNGNEWWLKNGLRHREDGPAVIYTNGTQKWWQNGGLHREDGPAIIEKDGTQEWWQNGQRHREDGPAIVTPDGKKYWFKNGISYYPENAGFIPPP